MKSGKQTEIEDTIQEFWQYEIEEMFSEFSQKFGRTVSRLPNNRDGGMGKGHFRGSLADDVSNSDIWNRRAEYEWITYSITVTKRGEGGALIIKKGQRIPSN